jgi:hypothetical protein
MHLHPKYIRKFRKVERFDGCYFHCYGPPLL